MAPITLEEVNKNLLSLQKELHELREAVHLSNRYELAQAARDAREGKETWHSLDKV